MSNDGDDEIQSIFGDPKRYRQCIDEIGKFQAHWESCAKLAAQMPVVLFIPVILYAAKVITVQKAGVLIILCVVPIMLGIARFHQASKKLLRLHLRAVLCMPYSPDTTRPGEPCSWPDR